MKIQRRYPLLLVLVVLALALAVTNQSFVVANLIKPITQFIWLMVKGILAVDQEVYWGILLFAILVLGLRLIPLPQDNYRISAYSDLPHSEDRLEYWERLLSSAESDVQYRSSLQRSLESIAQTINALTEDNVQVKIVLPQPDKYPWKTIMTRWRRNVGRKRLMQTDRTYSEFEFSINRIIHEMESRLEIKDDEKFPDPNERE